ncbi:MAG TPA: AAA family ATPase, partial [Polyangiaceae bacterium]
MPHTLYLVPSGSGVGLTSIALGLVRALDNRGTRVAFFKPIAESVGHDPGPERSTHFIRHTSSLKPTVPLPLEEAARLILAHRSDELSEHVLRDFHASAGDADVVVVEGLAHSHDALGEGSLNRELVRTLSAEVILVGSLGETPLAEFESHLEIAARQYGGFGPGRVIGCIVNRVPLRDARARISGFGELGSVSVVL